MNDKPCRTCRFYAPPKWVREQCKNPEIGFDPNTGTRPGNVEPSEERKESGRCGPEGRFYEENRSATLREKVASWVLGRKVYEF